MKIALALSAAVALFGCGSVEETPNDCTAPCAGDPVADFANAQGGTNGRWLYLADTRTPNGATYEELTFGSVRGEPGWVSSSGTSPAGILSCAENRDAQGCAGLETSLLFFPGTDTDPALAFVAPDNGTYALTGKVQAATGDPEGLPQRFLLSRSSRHDLIDSRVHVTAPVPDDFTAEVELLAGDRLILTFVGGATDSVPVAFDFHLTLVANGAAAFPGACKLSATFSADDAFANPCGSQLEDLNDTTGGPLSMQADSVNEQAGYARQFATGQFLRAPGGPLDRTGDWTVQFWAKVIEPVEITAAFYADWNIDVYGGVNISPIDPSEIEVCSMFHGTAMDTTCVTGPRPTDGAWHFYRVARSIDEAEVEVCIDGVKVGGDPNPGTLDMTGDQPPYIARNVDFNPAYFKGAMDEVRAFKRALPCPTP